MNFERLKENWLAEEIDFREADCAARLPYHDAAFDLVINRHGDFDARELFRIMKPNGIFITEQVGAGNDHALVDLLLPNTPPPFPEQQLPTAVEQFEQTGFKILDRQEAFRPIEFYDIGALVWFARIIEWEFPGFSVERCFPQLCMAQQMLDESGMIEGQIHRFLIVAQKLGL